MYVTRLEPTRERAVTKYPELQHERCPDLLQMRNMLSYGKKPVGKRLRG